MKVEIRLEQPTDYSAVEELIRDAFWGQSQAKCDEHYLAHILRKSSDFIPELDYVAEVDGKIAGNIMYSKAMIKSSGETCHEVLTFGPLAVAPAYQNLGVGKALVTETLKKAQAMNYPAVVIYGEPDYYPKLGFQLAEKFGITTAEGKNFDAFMCYPLHVFKAEIAGRFYESSIFHFDEQAARAFDNRFPPKEPRKIIPITSIPLSDTVLQKLLASGIKHMTDFHRYSSRELKQLVEDRTDQQTINTCLSKNGYPERF